MQESIKIRELLKFFVEGALLINEVAFNLVTRPFIINDFTAT